MKLKSEFLMFACLILLVCFVADHSCEYANEDEPPCRDDCYLNQFNLNEQQQSDCLKQYMEFYSYKMVKSMFNFAKTSVYAGLWVNRYENSDENLFSKVFYETLNRYNNPEILGSLSFGELNRTAQYVFEQLKYLTLKREETLVKYESYPSLVCPIPCSYELVTWQTMFYLALTIFALAIATVLLYSYFLRKQYVQLKERAKSLKYAKVESS